MDFGLGGVLDTVMGIAGQAAHVGAEIAGAVDQALNGGDSGAQSAGNGGDEGQWKQQCHHHHQHHHHHHACWR
jgi:hypothetical protein